MTHIPPDAIDLSKYDTTQLLRLRERVNNLLPSGEIEDLDLSAELVWTYMQAKQAIKDALDEDKTPINQISSAFGSMNTILKTLSDMQKNLFTVERAQKLERALAETLKEFPELQDRFFEKFEAAGQ